MVAVTVELDEASEAYIDDIVSRGLYGSRDEVLNAGLQLVRVQACGSDTPLSAEDRAAIEEGLADVAAGRVRDIGEVRREMGARFGAAVPRR